MKNCAKINKKSTQKLFKIIFKTIPINSIKLFLKLTFNVDFDFRVADVCLKGHPTKDIIHFDFCSRCQTIQHFSNVT